MKRIFRIVGVPLKSSNRLGGWIAPVVIALSMTGVVWAMSYTPAGNSNDFGNEKDPALVITPLEPQEEVIEEIVEIEEVIEEKKHPQENELLLKKKQEELKMKEEALLKKMTAEGKSKEEIVKACPQAVFDMKKGKFGINKDNAMNCHLCGACTDLSPDIKINESDKEFVFTIESWGQLKPKDMLLAAIDEMQKKLDDFEKIVKK